MIKLFVTDLDGCISIPFKAPEWNLVSEIRNLNRNSLEDKLIPPLSICSGRPYPYVEAVAQWLDVRMPVIFESGTMYDLGSNSFHHNGTFSEEALNHVNDLKQWMRDQILPKFPRGILEFAKLMDAGFVHPEKKVIEEALPVIESHVREHYPEFEVHHTDISINVILSKNNKRSGILKLCDKLQIEPEEVAYIGDSNGDIPALEIVGRSYAPFNARESVKEVVDHPLQEEATEAVLRAYRDIIEENGGYF